ncbi:MAG: MerR family DNA-binding transcriptional regulator [Streptosporangiaceae bacterium]
MLQPCPWGKVKWDDGRVITIGQLAGYVGVSTKTIRVYHNKGLLPEPDRDNHAVPRSGRGSGRPGTATALPRLRPRT